MLWIVSLISIRSSWDTRWTGSRAGGGVRKSAIGNLRWQAAPLPLGNTRTSAMTTGKPRSVEASDRWKQEHAVMFLRPLTRGWSPDQWCTRTWGEKAQGKRRRHGQRLCPAGSLLTPDGGLFSAHQGGSNQAHSVQNMYSTVPAISRVNNVSLQQFSRTLSFFSPDITGICPILWRSKLL